MTFSSNHGGHSVDVHFSAVVVDYKVKIAENY